MFEFIDGNKPSKFWIISLCVYCLSWHI